MKFLQSLPKGLQTFLLCITGLFALPLLVFAIAYLATSGSYAVPATVIGDANLPQVELNQARFHVETYGDPASPPLLALHDGPGGDMASLSALRALADSHYVILFDQRGSGLSARVPAEQLTIEHQLKDIAAIADHYAPGKPLRLYGHGWGGMLATAFAGRWPTRVERLILAEPGFLNTEMAGQVLPVMNQASAGFIFTAAGNWVRALHLSPGDADAREDFVFARLRHHPAYYCGGKVPAGAPDYTRRAGFRAWRALTGSTHNGRGQIELDFTKGLSNYRHPVLLLAGQCNHLTGKAFQTRQARLFPSAGVVTVPESGHELLLDQPEASLKVIRPFLASGQLPKP